MGTEVRGTAAREPKPNLAAVDMAGRWPPWKWEERGRGGKRRRHGGKTGTPRKWEERGREGREIVRGDMAGRRGHGGGEEGT